MGKIFCKDEKTELQGLRKLTARIGKTSMKNTKIFLFKNI